MNNKADFEREVLDRLMRLETKIDLQDYKSLSEKVEFTHNKSKQNEKDICDIEDKLKWITRTVIGALITGLISVAFVILKMGLNL